jgi:hypothetical protein
VRATEERRRELVEEGKRVRHPIYREGEAEESQGQGETAMALRLSSTARESNGERRGGETAH